MEITTTGSGSANHELATTQAGGQKQTAETEKNQAIKEAVDAVEVSFSRESLELAGAHSDATEDLTKVDLTEGGEKEETAAHQERQDLLEADEQQREEKGINPSINVFA